jgi:hypothetical protein
MRRDVIESSHLLLREAAMYVPLVPCPGCGRHVRNQEDTCPFCGATLAAEVKSRIAPDTTRRLGRAAAFVFGATVAVTTACGDSTVVKDGTGGAGGGNPTAGGAGDAGGSGVLYGGAPGGFGGDPAGNGGNAAMYGDPGVGGDAGAGGAGGGGGDGGSAMGLYGSPSPAP